MIAEYLWRRLFYGFCLVLVLLVSALTLVEILRTPVGACASSPGSAACARQRAVILLPWVGLGAAVALLVLRGRARRYPARAFIPERKGGRPLARLYVIDGPPALVGKNLNIQGSVTAIGRDPSLADLQLYQPHERSSIGGRHCIIRYDRHQFTLTDQGSANGTQVNGRPLAPGSPVVLKDGDEITLGDAARQGAILRFQANLPALSILPPPREAVPAYSGDLDAEVEQGAAAADLFADSGKRPPQRERRQGSDALEDFFSSVESTARQVGGRRALRGAREGLLDAGTLDPDDDRLWAPERHATDDSWMDRLS